LQAQNSCNSVYPRHTVCFKDVIVNNLQKIADNNNNNNNNNNNDKKEDKGKEKQ
jgi:hypothetical protein